MAGDLPGDFAVFIQVLSGTINILALDFDRQPGTLTCGSSSLLPNQAEIMQDSKSSITADEIQLWTWNTQ